MRIQRSAIAVLFAISMLPAWQIAATASQSGIVMGTMQPRDSFVGRVMDRIYAEAFRRIDKPFEGLSDEAAQPRGRSGPH